MDITLSSSMAILDFTTGAMDMNFLNTMSFVQYEFSLNGGYDLLNDGPPAMYQSTTYIEVPKGGMTDTSVRATGTSTFIVYDAGFRYTSASKSNGVGAGADTDYTGVDFQIFKGI